MKTRRRQSKPIEEPLYTVNSFSDPQFLQNLRERVEHVNWFSSGKQKQIRLPVAHFERLMAIWSEEPQSLYKRLDQYPFELGFGEVKFCGMSIVREDAD